MLGGIKKANYFIAFEITLIQRAMIQTSYVYHAHLCDIIVINTCPGCALDSCYNNDITLVA